MLITLIISCITFSTPKNVGFFMWISGVVEKSYPHFRVLSTFFCEYLLIRGIIRKYLSIPNLNFFQDHHVYRCRIHSTKCLFVYAGFTFSYILFYNCRFRELFHFLRVFFLPFFYEDKQKEAGNHLFRTSLFKYCYQIV